MPSPSQDPAAPCFTGAVCHKVEGKNRITIPSAWRFDEEVKLFMLPKSEKACVSVMTRVQLDRIMADAEKIEVMIERSNFFDMIGADLREVTMDKGGRISLPEDFFPLLGLPAAREVWLVGSMRTFNIWSLQNFEAQKVVEAERKFALKQKLGI